MANALPQQLTANPCAFAFRWTPDGIEWFEKRRGEPIGKHGVPFREVVIHMDEDQRPVQYVVEPFEQPIFVSNDS